MGACWSSHSTLAFLIQQILSEHLPLCGRLWPCKKSLAPPGDGEREREHPEDIASAPLSWTPLGLFLRGGHEYLDDSLSWVFGNRQLAGTASIPLQLLGTQKVSVAVLLTLHRATPACLGTSWNLSVQLPGEAREGPGE